MKKTPISLLLLAGLLLVSSLVRAQAPASPDVLYLKDGSVIRGTLIESITGSHVRFQNLEGQVREYPMSEVSSTKISGKNNRPVYELQHIGFSHSSSLGIMVGNSGYYGDQANPSFHTINGVRIGKHWSTGVGTGLEGFGYGTQMPIFAHGRYAPLKGAVSPFIDGMVGYSLPITSPRYNLWRDNDDQNRGGITAGIGAGVKMMAGQRFGLTIGMGYRFQRLNRTYQSSWWNGAEIFYYDIQERTDIHRIDLRFGILFN